MMATLVVHPAYRRRGHATELIKWSKDLSRIDEVPQGVSAAGMGQSLYKKLGYTHVTWLEEEGDKEDPRGVHTELLRYDPNGEGLLQRIKIRMQQPMSSLFAPPPPS